MLKILMLIAFAAGGCDKLNESKKADVHVAPNTIQIPIFKLSDHSVFSDPMQDKSIEIPIFVPQF